MNIQLHDTVQRGHAHDVDLEDTFDFLNTDDTDNGFPAEKLPTLDDALTWFVDRGVIHTEGAEPRPGAGRSRSWSATSRISMPSDRPCARSRPSITEHRAPDAGSLELVNRALHARQVIELVAGARRLQRRPPPRRRPDRRRPGEADRAVRHRADRRPPRADQDLRERDLRVDLLRHLTDEPPALVRHGDLRQPGQGGPPPGADQGDLRREGADGATHAETTPTPYSL